MRTLALALLLAVPIGLVAASVTVPNTFANDTVADATKVNANFSALATAVNDKDTRVAALEAGSAGPWLKSGNDVGYTGGVVSIGTTEKRGTLTVGGSIALAGGLIQRDVFQYRSTDLGAVPVQLKTQWRTNNDVMYRIQVEGYNYGVGLPINSDCVGYLYSQSDNTISAACTNYASGITLTQYKTSDGYLALKVASSSLYFIGFSVSVWQVNPGTFTPTTFTAVRQTANL